MVEVDIKTPMSEKSDISNHTVVKQAHATCIFDLGFSDQQEGSSKGDLQVLGRRSSAGRKCSRGFDRTSGTGARLEGDESTLIGKTLGEKVPFLYASGWSMNVLAL